jgi:hypothetical protein
MFDNLKVWIVKQLTGTWLKKAIRNGLMLLATWLMASDNSLCAQTTICKDLADWLGGSSEILIEKAIEVIMFLVGLIMTISAGKAESVGREVLKEKK